MDKNNIINIQNDLEHLLFCISIIRKILNQLPLNQFPKINANAIKDNLYILNDQNLPVA
ncbi:MAG: hypothetical protein ACTSVK_07715 [Promethearchaeota archaeon]